MPFKKKISIYNKSGLKLITFSHWEWILPILIVLLFNIPYFFVDILWNDDSYWYYKASASEGVVKFLWRGASWWRDYTYSYGMVYLGLPVIRGIYTIVLSVTSLLLYLFYNRLFGIKPIIAMAVAIIPNVLPSLKDIPLGLNSTYAVFGLLPLIASMLFLHIAFSRKNLQSLPFYLLAFGFYVIGLFNTGTITKFIPLVLFFFLFYFPKQKLRTIIYGIPFLVVGAFRAVKMTGNSRIDPQAITSDEILDRIYQFFEMSSFLPFDQSYSIYITAGLSLLGILGLVLAGSYLYNKPEHIHFDLKYYRLLMVAWPLCWILFTAYPYVKASTTFVPYRYAYVFNYGAVYLQIMGIAFLVYILLSFSKYLTYYKKVLTIILGGVIISTGFQRINECNYRERSSEVIRNTLSAFEIPKDAQIMILDYPREWYIPHPGHIMANSGLIRYLMRRNDLHALMGWDRYPVDVFDKSIRWEDRMLNFSPNRPIIAFRYSEGSLDRIDLMLQVNSTPGEDGSMLKWRLYDLTSIQKIDLIAEGTGMRSYYEYINRKLPDSYRSNNIAFAPKEVTDHLISDSVADMMMGYPGLIENEVKVEDYFTVRNIFLHQEDNKSFLKILIRADKIPEEAFKLTYYIEGKRKFVPIWDFARENDHILITSGQVDANELKKGLKLGFVNTRFSPYIKLLYNSGKYTGQSQIIIGAEQ